MRRAAVIWSALAIAGALVRAQSPLAGIWHAEVGPNTVWNFHLQSEGQRLTGIVDSGNAPLEISDGLIEGNTFVFKIDSLDGDRTITVKGTVTGNEIAFTRDVQVRQGGNPGGAGIEGAKGPLTFAARRVPPGQAPRRARGAQWLRQLTIFDRSGRVVRTLGEPAFYNQPVFSPDGRRLAIVLLNDIWIVDIERGSRTRLTSSRWPETAPIWSPDGRYVAYQSIREGTGALYRKASDGTGAEELLYRHTPGAAILPTDWSSDGRLLSFGSGGLLFALPLDGERRPLELAREEFALQAARFSPDTRFLAYRSDESDQWEIYIQGFDRVKGLTPVKQQISKGGLGMVHWRADGRELIYLATDRGLMSVDVTTTPQLRASAPRLLFQAPDSIPTAGTPGALGSVSRDGQRIALLVPVAPERREITVPVDTLAKYAGTYELFGEDAQFSLEGGRLFALGFGERSPMFAQSDTSFFFKDGRQEIEFVTDEKGAVTHFLFYQGGPPTRAPRK